MRTLRDIINLMPFLLSDRQSHLCWTFAEMAQLK